MSNQRKISTLIQSWSDYIWLSDLTNAEVDAGDSDRPCIWDKGISLLGDNLLLSEPLFAQIQKQFFEFKKKGKTSEFQIALAFPQIYVIKDGTRKFRPLFTQEISSIFEDDYRDRGWNLTEFDFYPVLPNLIDLYHLEEAEVESLVTREGLKVF